MRQELAGLENSMQDALHARSPALRYRAAALAHQPSLSLPCQ